MLKIVFTKPQQGPYIFVPINILTAVEAKQLSEQNETNCQVLDDAQGYGYRTKQKAHAAYNYKNRDRSKDKKRKQEEKAIKKWWQEHKELNKLLQRIAVEILKGSWGPDDKLDAKLLKEIMKQNQVESDFSAGKLLRVWKKMSTEPPTKVGGL